MMGNVVFPLKDGERLLQHGPVASVAAEKLRSVVQLLEQLPAIYKGPGFNPQHHKQTNTQTTHKESVVLQVSGKFPQTHSSPVLVMLLPSGFQVLSLVWPDLCPMASAILSLCCMKPDHCPYLAGGQEWDHSG